jgi:hypothetical protein
MDCLSQEIHSLPHLSDLTLRVEALFTVHLCCVHHISEASSFLQRNGLSTRIRLVGRVACVQGQRNVYILVGEQEQQKASGRIMLSVIQWSLGLRYYRLTIFQLTIRLSLGPIVSISDKCSINDMLMMIHGTQFRPIGGLSRPQQISDLFYERLELSWLTFQWLMCVACGNSCLEYLAFSYIQLMII